MDLPFKNFKITPIKKTTFIVSLILLITKTINFFIDLLVAQYFGVNQYVDIYLYALMVPLLVNAVLSNSFTQYFIPNYLRIKSQQQAEYKQDYLFVILICYTALVLLVSLLSCGTLPYLLAQINPALFNSDDLIQTYFRFSRWIGVYFFFFTLSNFFVSILQAEHQYKDSLYPQIFIPFIGVISILTLHQYLRIFSIIYGFVLGAIISFLLIYFKTAQKKLFSFKRIRFNFHILKTGTDFHQFFYLFIALIFPTFVSFIDKQAATYLGPGKLSALSYGQSIPNALSSILAYSLGIAVFSYFSEWTVKNETNKLVHAVRKAIYFLVIIIIPFCYYVFLFSSDIIGIFFERGKFTIEETSSVSPILQFYIFSIFFHAATMIATRIVSAIHKNKFFIILYPSIFVIKLLFNTILVRYFDILGLPLSTLAMYFIYCVWIYCYLNNKNIQIFNIQYFWTIIKSILYLLILLIIFYRIYSFINFLNLNYFGSLFYGSSLFIIIYLIFLRILYKKRRGLITSIE